MIAESTRHLPDIRRVDNRDDADGRLPVFLQMHRLRHAAASKAGRLLRILFLRDSFLARRCRHRAVSPTERSDDKQGSRRIFQGTEMRTAGRWEAPWPYQ
jgi:hypothetical protein